MDSNFATVIKNTASKAMKVVIHKAINDLFEENGTFECKCYVNKSTYTEYNWDTISFSAKQEPSKGDLISCTHSHLFVMMYTSQEIMT